MMHFIDQPNSLLLVVLYNKSVYNYKRVSVIHTFDITNVTVWLGFGGPQHDLVSCDATNAMLLS